MTLIRELSDANARTFTADLEDKLKGLRRSHALAKPGGDWEETVCVQIAAVECALNAARAVYAQNGVNFSTPSVEAESSR